MFSELRVCKFYQGKNKVDHLITKYESYLTGTLFG